MATTYNKITVDPAGLPITVDIRALTATGSAVTAYTQENGSTPHTFPQLITAVTDYYTTLERGDVYVYALLDGISALQGAYSKAEMGRGTVHAIQAGRPLIIGTGIRVAAGTLTTTDGTPSDLLFGPSPGRLLIPNDTCWGFEAHIVCRRTDADNIGAYYVVRGAIDNNANTVALVGTVNTTTVGEDTAGQDATASADNTNKSLKITCTGTAAQNILWNATVILVQVTG